MTVRNINIRFCDSIINYEKIDVVYSCCLCIFMMVSSSSHIEFDYETAASIYGFDSAVLLPEMLAVSSAGVGVRLGLLVHY